MIMSFFSIEPTTIILIAASIALIASFASLAMGKRLTHTEKILMFTLISIPIMLSTLYLGAYTVNQNFQSVTGGPVHWHVDYQVWVCDERLDLVDPKFPSNKIGTPVLHEHNDDRIHVEGTIMRLSEANLGTYFNVIGGRITAQSITYPTQDQGIIDKTNGDLCDGQPSTLKVYVNGERIPNPATYVMYPHEKVPPADCVIVEFSPGNEHTTERICESWRASQSSDRPYTYENYEENRAQYHDYVKDLREEQHLGR